MPTHGGRPEFTDLGLHNPPLSQEDDDLIAELLRQMHVVGADQDGPPPLGVPHKEPLHDGNRFGVQPPKGLIQNEYLRRVHETRH